ncbi:glycosyltransferase [Alkalihalobacillus sp. BA299]|uniref:glycosyltransferase n=1 Tax=Alkalihalobacillus sp. BA299 TaxID=2815938 RepID=UPI001ADB09D5|nr:glycosyltransferase [Alkalihalobacillus sp. BA299]
MDIKVSVIIPVYNAEQYLSHCIESLLKQTLQQCEFIFINDGSIDDSQQIIEKYKKKDPRIRLINQKNQGVSIARNTGIEIASGEYIGFVDADDYIESDMYEQMYTAAITCKCDVVITNFESEIKGQKVITTYPFPQNQILNRNFIVKELLAYLIKSENMNTVCNKIYLNQRVIDNKIKFPEKVALGEDGMFNMLFFSIASSLVYISYTGYHYREVSGSATKNLAKFNYFDRAVEVYESQLPSRLANTLGEKKIQELKAIKFINSVLSYIYIYFTATEQLSYKERYNFVKTMIHHEKVREALTIYSKEFNNLGRYEKFLLDMVKRRSTFSLYCATTYSKLRN